MIRKDYHMHTTYCDGTRSPEEMVLAAIDQGLEEIGFSGHSHTPFDESYCMSHESTQQFFRELASLREKYAGRISIKIGLEMDLWSDADAAGWEGAAPEYRIGSMHYIRIPAEENTPCPPRCCPWEGPEGRFVYIPVDESPELLRSAADAYFDGDMIELAVKYFEEVSGVVEATKCDIIGHFDLITKFNEPAGGQGTKAEQQLKPGQRGVLLDEEDPRYVAAWKAAVDRLVQYDIPFEINTGAMAKGYRTSPYPAKPIRDYIRSKGGRFILSSDSHRADTLCYCFDRYEGEVSQD